MSIYTPTYLYIKQHTLTGKLYFGKTIRNPETYTGSGTHWLNHIKKHGKEHVVTLWYCLFLDQESCTEFALNFSKQQNIAESTNWLNQKPENGLDGIQPGTKHPASTIEAMRIAKLGNIPGNKGKTITEDQKHAISKAQKGKLKSPEHRAKIANSLKGVKRGPYKKKLLP